MKKSFQTTGGVTYLRRPKTTQTNKELGVLLERLLFEKHQGNFVAAVEAYAIERHAQIDAQTARGQTLDDEELRESMIAWALIELGELTTEGKPSKQQG